MRWLLWFKSGENGARIHLSSLAKETMPVCKCVICGRGPEVKVDREVCADQGLFGFKNPKPIGDIGSHLPLALQLGRDALDAVGLCHQIGHLVAGVEVNPPGPAEAL